MKLKDAVKFVQHNGCACYATDVEHYTRIILKDGSTQDGSTDELTREILEKYGNAEVLKVNVDVFLEGHELMDCVIYEFYLDI